MLTDLAHHLLAWTREWSFHDSPCADAGIPGRVQELLPILGTVAVAAGWAAKGGEFAWLFGDSLLLWAYATYLQNFAMASGGTMGPDWLGITWSLAIEEQFYVVLPFLVRCTVPLAGVCRSSRLCPAAGAMGCLVCRRTRRLRHEA